VVVCDIAVQGQEYAPHYMFDYQRTDDGPWFRFTGRKGVDVSVLLLLAT